MKEMTLEERVERLENKHAINAAYITVLERMIHALMHRHSSIAEVRKSFALMSEQAIAINLNNPDWHPYAEASSAKMTNDFLQLFDLMIEDQSAPKEAQSRPK